MSYILDALKKSEKQRQQEHGTSPLHAAQPSPPKPSGEEKRWNWWILPVILVTTGFVGYTLSSKISPSDTTTTVQLQETSIAKEQPEAELETRSVPELQPRNKKIVHQQREPEPRKTSQSLPEKTTEAAPAPGKTEKSRQDVPLLKELDPVTRESIPVFRLAGHVYSPDPQLRMIIINNSVVREGDVVKKGFVVEEITFQGVILRNKDLRFRMPID